VGDPYHEDMRAVVQRVTHASVTVAGSQVGAIDRAGLLVFLGITHDDTLQRAATVAAKIWHLRIFPEEMAAADLGAPLLVISQFTLYADTRKGRPGRRGAPRLHARSPSRCTTVSARHCAGSAPVSSRVSSVLTWPLTCATTGR